MADEEGLAVILLGVVFVTELLHQQVQAGAYKCVRWKFVSNDGLQVAVFGVEAAKEIQHLAGLRHGLADVAQLIGESLEPAAVLSDGHVTLAASR